MFIYSISMFLCRFLFLSGLPRGSDSKESASNAGGLGSIPGLGRSLREGNGHPCQNSGLENFMDCVAHGISESQTQLSDFQFSSVLFLSIIIHLHE